MRLSTDVAIGAGIKRILVSSLRLVVVVASLIGLAEPVQAQALYGVAWEIVPAGPGAYYNISTLYTIDPATGTANTVGTLVDSSGNVTCCIGIKAIAFHPTTGVLYAIDLDRRLLQIDPATAIATMIVQVTDVPIRFSGGGAYHLTLVGGIAFRADGVLFAMFLGSDGGAALATIDIATGVATAVGGLLNDGGAIAFSPAGDLLQSAPGQLETVDQTTGAVISSIPFSMVPFEPSEGVRFNPVGMGFDPATGVLFASRLSGGFVTIDPATGQVTAVGSIVSLALGHHLGGIAFVPGNTLSGSNVNVSLSPVTLTFTNVTQPGTTTLNVSTSGPPVPSGFKLGNPPTYFDLSTTATYTGSIQICVDYRAIQFGSVSSLRLMHFDSAAWVDITTSLDTVNQIICGMSSSLSPFGVFEPSDTTPPVLTLPGNLTAEATSAAGAVATFSATAIDAVDGPRPVSCVPASGSTFPLGTTTVNCSASDLSGNTANGSFTVTVRDTTPPVAACTPVPVRPDRDADDDDDDPASRNVFTVTGSDAVGPLSITIGPYSLVNGAVIKLFVTRRPGVVEIGNVRKSNIRRFRVGAANAFIRASDGAGNSTTVACTIDRDRSTDEDRDKHKDSDNDKGKNKEREDKNKR